MIQIVVKEGKTSSIAEIPSEHGPALRSALEEIRNELGERLAGAHSFAKEDALTRASSAIGRLSAAVNFVIDKEDPDYA